MNSTIWRKRIDQLMKERGMTQADLAKKMNVTPGYVSQFLSPSAIRGIGGKTLMRLAEIFGVPVDALMREEPPAGRLVTSFRLENQRIPLISWIRVPTWSATSARYLAEYAEEMVSFDINDPTAFAVRLPGNELEPFFYTGDVLIISPKAQPQENEYGLVADGDAIKLGRIAHVAGAVVLTTQKGLEIPSESRRFRIIGKVVGRISRF